MGRMSRSMRGHECYPSVVTSGSMIALYKRRRSFRKAKKVF
jgi:hypothetical protein